MTVCIFVAMFQRLAGRHCLHHFTCTSTPKRHQQHIPTKCW